MKQQARMLVTSVLIATMLTVTACQQVVNPATGERQLTTLSTEDEQRIGAEQHPRILVQYGGAYDEPELQAYVERIGNDLAAVSELPELEFTFTLLDSEIINAFALPGGYVYVSRGLLALAENEAELAGVIGHEIGHVTARHTAQRQTQATGAGILATLGTLGAAVLGGRAAADLAQQVAGTAAQGYVASFSRSQELEADQLGIRYLKRAGYDPNAMATFLSKLSRQSELERRLAGVEGDPGAAFLASHPRTADRVQAAVVEVGGGGTGRLDREQHLAAIDGLIYGANPRAGLVDGRRFIHPDLGFTFEAPPGFRLQNTPNAVVGRDQSGRLMVFELANPGGQSLDSYVSGDALARTGNVLNAEVSAPRNVRRTEVNGLPAALASATVRKGQGSADIGLAAIDAGERAYQFLFVSRGSMSAEEARGFAETVESFRRLSSSEAASFQPARIDVTTVGASDTKAALLSRFALDAADSRFDILNALALERGLTPGTQVKLVTK